MKNICMDFYKMENNSSCENKSVPIRPIINSLALLILLYPNKIKNYEGNDEISFGKYPQYVPTLDIQDELDKKYAMEELELMGRSYTFREGSNSEDIEHFEYKYKNKTYVNLPYLGKESRFLRWLEVAPIKWIIDEKERRLISKNKLISRTLLEGEDICDVQEFINEHMLKDIIKTEIFRYPMLLDIPIFDNENTDKHKYIVGDNTNYKIRKR